VNVCAVIPAFNEASSIAEVVRGVAPHVAHVLVVDDGSADGTAERAAAAGAEVISIPGNRGKGASIRLAFDRVLRQSYTHVLLLDGDLQHDPAKAPAFLEKAAGTGADLIIGERPFVRETMAASRYHTNVISSWVISKFFVGQRVLDAQSGYRLIRTDTLRRIRLTGRGYEIETEMLIKLARKGARITSVPIPLQDGRSPSKLRPVRDTTRTCFLAVRYRFFPEWLQ
jgi:glycosyltransferase involved in cell wall biosynthesis